MTLIASVASGGTGLFCVADTLLSASRPDAPDVRLPLHEELVAHRGPSGAVVGLAQKMVRVSPTIVAMWAGSAIVARVLISGLRMAGSSGRRIDLEELAAASGLSPDELAAVSLIVHQVRGELLLRSTLNAREGIYGGVPAAWEGTGSFDFFDDMLFEPAEDWSPEVVMRSLLVRVVTVLLEEAQDRSTFDYFYGGWFELLVSRTSALRKVPYAIKFWGRRGGELGYDAPLFFNWYKGRTLYVCSLDQRSGSSDVRIVEVPDFLTGRRAGQVKVAPHFAPEFTFHVVLDDDGTIELHVSDRHSLGHVRAHVSLDGSYTMQVNRGFVDMLMSRSVVPAFRGRRASNVV